MNAQKSINTRSLYMHTGMQHVHVHNGQIGAAERHKGALTRTPTPQHRGTVKSDKSMLASARYGGVWALTELRIDGFKILASKKFSYTSLTPGSNPVNVL